MLNLLTGNILKSDAYCLINTVNCEGFMGKGLAYQFKNAFPETNDLYKEVCNKNQLHTGELNYNIENNKLVVNFPTKNKWREKSKIEYIHEGMKALVKLIKEKNIQSVAIPPLGSGNGGLDWLEVKEVIMDYMFPLAKDIDILIYEPSINYSSTIKKAPKLTMSHLVLMNIKEKLNKFTKFRLQKAAFFINIFSKQDYFNFVPHHYGPYSHSLEILSRDIKEFQEFHKFKTNKALIFAHNTLISKKVEQKLLDFKLPIIKATEFINSYSSNDDIELLSSICFILLKNKNMSDNEIIDKIQSWSELKKKKFSNKQINLKITKLVESNLIQKDILNTYSLKL